MTIPVVCPEPPLGLFVMTSGPAGRQRLKKESGCEAPALDLLSEFSNHLENTSFQKNSMVCARNKEVMGYQAGTWTQGASSVSLMQTLLFQEGDGVKGPLLSEPRRVAPCPAPVCPGAHKTGSPGQGVLAPGHGYSEGEVDLGCEGGGVLLPRSGGTARPHLDPLCMSPAWSSLEMLTGQEVKL